MCLGSWTKKKGKFPKGNQCLPALPGPDGCTMHIVPFVRTRRRECYEIKLAWEREIVWKMMFPSKNDTGWLDRGDQGGRLGSIWMLASCSPPFHCSDNDKLIIEKLPIAYQGKCDQRESEMKWKMEPKWMQKKWKADEMNSQALGSRDKLNLHQWQNKKIFFLFQTGFFHFSSRMRINQKQIIENKSSLKKENRDSFAWL